MGRVNMAKNRSCIQRMLLPHEEHEKIAVPPGGLAKVQHDALTCVHSKPVSYFLIFCLVMDVVLTLGEFVIQHQQCDYQSKHVIMKEVKIEFEAHESDRRSVVPVLRLPSNYK